MSRIAKYSPALGQPLKSFSVDLEKCRERTDFGKGYYLTTSLKQARDWANSLSLRDLTARKKEPHAAVLQFTVDLDSISQLENLWFVCDSPDFVTFISDCRRGNKHARSKPVDYFDMVSGPVTLFPQLAVIKDSDQVSFHTSSAAALLGTPRLIEMGRISGTIATAYVQ